MSTSFNSNGGGSPRREVGCSYIHHPFDDFEVSIVAQMLGMSPKEAYKVVLAYRRWKEGDKECSDSGGW